MTNPFSLRRAFAVYGWRGFGGDAVKPSIVGIIVSVLTAMLAEEPLVVLSNLIGIGLSILPTVLAILLTAYALVLTLIDGWSFGGERRDEATILIEKVNSDFTVCCVFSVIGVLVFFMASFFHSLGLTPHAPWWVCPCLSGLLSFVFLICMEIIIDLIRDVFNCGQTLIFKKQ